jgi:SAM-dependent methyltransferase
MRRRRSVRQARERWAFGKTMPLARMLDSQAAWAARYPRVERIIDVLQLGRGRRYLDIGCGTGSFAELLGARAGLDSDPVVADLAATDGADLIAWPEQLPFGDRSFDCITSFHYVHRFDDDVFRAFASEISRVLAPGGTAILVDYAPVRLDVMNRVHERLLRFDAAVVDLRGWGRLSLALTHCGFGAVDLVSLGPGFLPPIPRVAVVLRHVPEPGDSP